MGGGREGSIKVYQFCVAAITNCHKLAVENCRNVFSLTSEGQKPQISITGLNPSVSRATLLLEAHTPSGGSEKHFLAPFSLWHSFIRGRIAPISASIFSSLFARSSHTFSSMCLCPRSLCLSYKDTVIVF